MLVSFTFDDATKDHIRFAAPILEKYGYRGLFNIVTEVVGRDSTFLTWDDVRDLIARGHAVAAHGMRYHSGRNSNDLAEKWKQGKCEEVRREIMESRRIIEQEIGMRVKYFCFPHNAANRVLLRMVRKEGMIPVRCSRQNFGGKGYRWTVSSTGEWIDAAVAKGIRYGALMFHGIVRQDNGFAPFDDDDGSGFETCVKEVKARDGRSIKVIRYSEADWPIYQHRPLTRRIFNQLKRIMG